MSTYYVFLGSDGSGHAGTVGDPFSSTDFNTHINSSTPQDGDVYKMKGQDATYLGIGTVNIVPGGSNKTISLEPWDPIAFGPWRIQLPNSDDLFIGSVTNNIGVNIKGGIIAGDGGLIDVEINNVPQCNSMVFTGFDDLEFRNDSSTSSIDMTFNGCGIYPGSLYFGTSSESSKENVDIVFNDCITNFSYVAINTDPDTTATATLNNCATNLSQADWSNGGGAGLEWNFIDGTNNQYSWSAVSSPSWDATQTAWNANTLSTGITTPPQPGTPPYTGYDIGLFGNSRDGIGACNFPGLITLSRTPERDSVDVTLGANIDYITENLTSGDGYLDQTAEIGKIVVYYEHEDGRQSKRTTLYREDDFKAPINWSPIARDGTWTQNKLRIIGRERAENSYYDGTDYTGSYLIFS